MRRRSFLTLLGGGVLVWPLAARAQRAAPPPGAPAQPSVVPEIGLLNSLSFAPSVDRLAAFFEGLEDTGFVVDRNVAVEFRSAEGQAARLPALAADLVRRNSSVIVCLTSAQTVRAAMVATS